jgi:hypothetical protein
MQFNIHQQYKIKQGSAPDLSGVPAIGITDTKKKNAVHFVKEETKIVDKMNEDTGKLADVVNENVIEKER